MGEMNLPDELIDLIGEDVLTPALNFGATRIAVTPGHQVGGGRTVSG
jgi:hypothetical protein